MQVFFPRYNRHVRNAYSFTNFSRDLDVADSIFIDSKVDLQCKKVYMRYVNVNRRVSVFSSPQFLTFTF